MQPLYETFYPGRSGFVGRILLKNGAPVPDLSSVNRIDLEIGSVVVTSTDAAAGVIQWGQPGFAQGEIRIFPKTLKSLAVSSSLLIAVVIVYDPTNPDGLPWGSFGAWVRQV